MKRLRSLALSLCLLIVVCGLAVAEDHGSRLHAGRQGIVISVSDIHFDPLLTTDKAVAGKIKNSGYLRWHEIYSSSSDKHISPVGEETNYNLLASTLVQMKQACPAPDFILFSGDLLAHKFRKYHTEVFSGDERAFRAFVKETLKFIGAEFHRTFPRVHVVFTLGNNDSYEDYEIEPNGSFLHDTMNLYFTHYLKAEPARLNSFASTFRSGGNYAFPPAVSSESCPVNQRRFLFRKERPQRLWMAAAQVARGTIENRKEKQAERMDCSPYSSRCGYLEYGEKRAYCGILGRPS